mmetsp:Transcript_55263/g.109790  ORF Transcript_55263/g.109790 Transcript_55263/m.109790 type:complete len:227 (+) Transcript_55263:56-736(+)
MWFSATCASPWEMGARATCCEDEDNQSLCPSHACGCFSVDADQRLPARDTRWRKRRETGKTPGVTHKHAVLQNIDDLTRELFHIHDLNGNGLLEESELIDLNEKIAILHHGSDVNIATVRRKYQDLFRTKMDPQGCPVPFSTFQEYAQEVLDGLDTDPEAQEMILEQFVAEARSGREALGIRLDEQLDSNDGSSSESTASGLETLAWWKRTVDNGSLLRTMALFPL